MLVLNTLDVTCESARPAEIDKTRGAQRGKADCRLHRLCPHIFAKNGGINEMKEKLFIWSFVQLVIISHVLVQAQYTNGETR